MIWGWGVRGVGDGWVGVGGIAVGEAGIGLGDRVWVGEGVNVALAAGITSGESSLEFWTNKVLTPITPRKTVTQSSQIALANPLRIVVEMDLLSRGRLENGYGFDQQGIAACILPGS